MGRECGDRRGAACPHQDRLLIRDRNVRVLGDNEGVEPPLLHRRAQPSWTNALVGDESCDTKLHTALNPSHPFGWTPRRSLDCIRDLDEPVTERALQLLRVHWDAI